MKYSDDIAYFDYAAMTPVDPRVAEVLREAYEDMPVGNAGSTHRRGLAAKAKVDEARVALAESIGADPREIVFTSGATEADNLAIKGALEYVGVHNARLITVQTEHKAVLDSAGFMAKKGANVVTLPVMQNGLLSLDLLEQALREQATTLVSVMAVNNETGVIQPIADIARLTHRYGAKLHVDAAQAPGRITVNIAAWDADMVSLAGQKVYAPQGIGALYVRRLPKMRIQPQLHGGGQERGMRSGTLPIALIMAFAHAMKLVCAEREQHSQTVKKIREQLIASLPTKMKLNTDEETVPNIISLNTLHDSSAVLAQADKAGLALSAGSACSSGGSGSHVLSAMGLESAAKQSIRISLSHLTQAAEVDRLVHFLGELGT